MPSNPLRYCMAAVSMLSFSPYNKICLIGYSTQTHQDIFSGPGAWFSILEQMPLGAGTGKSPLFPCIH